MSALDNLVKINQFNDAEIAQLSEDSQFMLAYGASPMGFSKKMA